MVICGQKSILKNYIHLVHTVFENSLNLETNLGNTPLHFSAQQGNVELTKILLVFGSNPYYPNKNQETPIQLAHSRGHGQISAICVRFSDFVRQNQLISQNDLNWFAYLDDVKSLEKIILQHSKTPVKLLEDLGKCGLGMGLNPLQIAAHFECQDALIFLLKTLWDLSEENWAFKSGSGIRKLYKFIQDLR